MPASSVTSTKRTGETPLREAASTPAGGGRRRPAAGSSRRPQPVAHNPAVRISAHIAARRPGLSTQPGEPRFAWVVLASGGRRSRGVDRTGRPKSSKGLSIYPADREGPRTASHVFPLTLTCEERINPPLPAWSRRIS